MNGWIDSKKLYEFIRKGYLEIEHDGYVRPTGKKKEQENVFRKGFRSFFNEKKTNNAYHANMILNMYLAELMPVSAVRTTLNHLYGPAPFTNTNIMKGKCRTIMTHLGYRLINDDICNLEWMFEGKPNKMTKIHTSPNGCFRWEHDRVYDYINHDSLFPMTCITNRDNVVMYVKNNIGFAMYRIDPSDYTLEQVKDLTEFYINLLYEHKDDYRLHSDHILLDNIVKMMQKIGNHNGQAEWLDEWAMRLYFVHKAVGVTIKNMFPNACTGVAGFRKLSSKRGRR